MRVAALRRSPQARSASMPGQAAQGGGFLGGLLVPFRPSEKEPMPRGGTRSCFLPPKAAPLRVPARRAGSHGDSLRGIQRGREATARMGTPFVPKGQVAPVALFECASPLCGARRRRGAHLKPRRAQRGKSKAPRRGAQKPLAAGRRPPLPKRERKKILSEYKALA